MVLAVAEIVPLRRRLDFFVRVGGPWWVQAAPLLQLTADAAVAVAVEYERSERFT